MAKKLKKAAKSATKAKAPARKVAAKKAAPTRAAKAPAAKPESRKSSLADAARELAGAAVEGGLRGMATGVAAAIADLAGSAGDKRATSGGGLPSPSTPPQGAVGKALDGMRILGELAGAVNKAMDSGQPTPIDPAAGSERGRIGNLNPQGAVRKK